MAASYKAQFYFAINLMCLFCHILMEPGLEAIRHKSKLSGTRMSGLKTRCDWTFRARQCYTVTHCYVLLLPVKSDTLCRASYIDECSARRLANKAALSDKRYFWRCRTARMI